MELDSATPRPVWAQVAVLGGISLAVGLAATVATGWPSWSWSSPGPSSSAAGRFLDRYVQSDGRVVRLDQGGDSVSEGQAYAMTMAEQRGDRKRFDAIWAWTGHHLQRADGLFSWHWQDGRVVDPMPASDADIDIAASLLRAAEHFDVVPYRREGLHVAEAILLEETAVAGGHLVLVAGPWARATPSVVNPGYLEPGTFGELARRTGDQRWEALDRDSMWLIEQLTGIGSRLPPDWALVGSDGKAWPSSPPAERNQAPRFGLEAARLEIRLATQCNPPSRLLAAAAWLLLRGHEPSGGQRLLDGSPTSGTSSPVLALAAAAAAHVAGRGAEAGRLIKAAESLDRHDPTYFGGSWLGLFATSHLSTTSCKGPT